MHVPACLQVLRWQKQELQDADLASGPSTSNNSSSRAHGKNNLAAPGQLPSQLHVEQALPFAIALAAALSVESPFVHIDALAIQGASEQNEAAQEGEEAGKMKGHEDEEEEEVDEEDVETPKKKKRRVDAPEPTESSGRKSSALQQQAKVQRGVNSAAEKLKAAAKEAAKAQAKAAASAQARFRCADSDALSALAALCAFEAAGESEDFCAASFLHR